MLSLLQKGDQSQMPVVPAWHPNFRNLERLPDTKVIRTQFFVNFAAAAIAASLLLYFCFQEYRINNLSRQVADWQAQIDTNKKASDQALVLSRRFSDEERKIGELNNFLKQRLVLSQFLLQIGNTLPPELAMDTVDFREASVSGRTSAYVEQLRQDKYFSAVFEEITLNKLEREQTSGRLTFDIFLRFKGAVTKK
jgi:hypothetical protein